MSLGDLRSGAANAAKNPLVVLAELWREATADDPRSLRVEVAEVAAAEDPP